MQEQYALLLAKLPDQTVRKIAIAKMEGYSTEEIAKTMGVEARTIQRELELIHACWQDHERRYLGNKSPSSMRLLIVDSLSCEQDVPIRVWDALRSLPVFLVGNRWH